ncbi:MAG: ABC transporter substrate-binding protein [Acidimicrobiales bacterium]|nr:ABC transporter substrate-binding protein [Acidimicrobiales bacterium]
MNWKVFDQARKDVGPVELDLIESYAQGKVSRRNFVKRGTIIGLSAPFMGAIIAACGSDGDEGGTTTTAGGGETDGSAATTAPAPTGGAGGNLVVAIQEGDANSGLDPVAMLDLGTYAACSQSFEYLVGLGADGNIADTGLATSWSPNADGSVWTFELRDGPVWTDGSPVTSADVAATMDRAAEFGNAGLAGVIGEGSTDSSDPKKAVITLLEPNGNFPVLVSIFNSQSLITPADYTSGTTLDERPEGSGPFLLESFDPTNFVLRYRRNENWWGGTPNLETVELRGFTDLNGTGVTAMTAREVDVLQNFAVVGGEGLLNDSNFVTLEPPSSNHRQLWFNTQQGQFAADKRLRQALGWTLNRDQMISVLFSGRAVKGNDHPILSTLPFFDESATPQRTVDIDMAKALMAEAGVDSITSTIEAGNVGEIPELAGIIAANAAPAGFNFSANVQDNSTFYGAAWCPGPSDSDPSLPCDGAADFGIVDYGHRPVPDIFLSSALSTGGVWNSSNFANAEFDSLLSQYRTAIDVDGQKAAIGKIQVLMHDEQPALYPFFFNFLAGHDASVSGVQVTALGHLLLGRASKA